MITRAKISAVRANSFVVVEQFSVFPGYSKAVLINFFVPDAALNEGRRLIEGGAYSSKYGMLSSNFFDPLFLNLLDLTLQLS